MMQFDEHKNLFPYQLIPSNLIEIKKVFVANFVNSQTRHDLWEAYLIFIEELKQIVKGEFSQWLNGSFVTLKTNPKDIDLVTLLDWNVFEANENELRQLVTKHRLIDAYFIKIYPTNHRLHHWYTDDCKRWQFDFGTSRSYKNKGIIELKF